MASRQHGTARNKVRRASSGVSLFEGSGRNGLLIESSMMDFGKRWLATLKQRRLSQFQRRTCGVRERIGMKCGVWFVVRDEPASALNIPTAVWVETIVFRSL